MRAVACLELQSRGGADETMTPAERSPSIGRPTGTAACPVCSSDRSSFVRSLPFRIGVDSALSDVERCRRCGSYWRSGLSHIDIGAHLATASYTDLRRE